MSRTLTIDTDDRLENALQERAQTQGKTVSETAREILSRALLGQRAAAQDEESRRVEAQRLPALNRREREHEWRRSNRELLQSRFAGKWIVLEGEEVVAHGTDARQAVEQARAKGVVVPYVFFVEPPRPPGVVRMGL